MGVKDGESAADNPTGKLDKGENEGDGNIARKSTVMMWLPSFLKFP
jgi:hypothetical protein